MSFEAEFSELADKVAPEGIRLLPCGLSEKKEQTYSDFLRRLWFEAQEILERGDHKIAREDIPFDERQSRTLFGAFLALRCLRENNPLNSDHRLALQSLYADMTDIRKYYEMKIEWSAGRKRVLPDELSQRRDYEAIARQRGEAGLREIYGLTQEKPQRDDGVIDLRDVRDQKELEEIYLNSRMATVSGWLPQSETMEYLGQEHAALPVEIKRNRQVLEAIHQFQEDLAKVYRQVGWRVPKERRSDQVVMLSL